MKTTLHTYRFSPDWRAQNADAAAYAALCERLTMLGNKKFVASTNRQPGKLDFCDPKLDGLVVEIDDAHLFDNQWNTKPVESVSENGLRLFDWFEEYGMARGHYLVITDEMRAAREARARCGYCGKQQPTIAHGGPEFCDACLGSEHMRVGDLYLTRMTPVMSPINYRLPPLEGDELAERTAKYHHAQTVGRTERDRALAAKRLQSVHEKYATATQHATTERDAMLWVLAHVPWLFGNTIFYDHIPSFCFGWRRALTSQEASLLTTAVAEHSFPFAYQIKLGDGGSETR